MAGEVADREITAREPPGIRALLKHAVEPRRLHCDIVKPARIACRGDIVQVVPARIAELLFPLQVLSPAGNRVL
jgi:hypothetical protein